MVLFLGAPLGSRTTSMLCTFWRSCIWNLTWVCRWKEDQTI